MGCIIVYASRPAQYVRGGILPPFQKITSAVRRPLLYAAVLLLVSAVTVLAQDATPPPGHIVIVDGSATIEREGQAEAAVANLPFVPGDRLRTTSGRVEVLFPDGTALDVDELTSVDCQSPTLLRLVTGRVMVIVSGSGNPASAVTYQIDTPAASVRTNGPGEY